MRQVFALATCLAATSGLVVELSNMLAQGYSPIEAIWRLGFYFTILTNVVVAALFGWLAIDGRPRPRIVGGVTSAILLVGVVYWALLEGVADLDGASPLGNFLLHKATPVMALAFWLVFTPKGHLSWHDPFVWLAFPMTYLAYALARGQIEGRYPYPFLDVGQIGWTGVAVGTAVIAGAFVAGGTVMVLADRLFGRR